MPKATYTTADGTKVVIEGTAEEVTALLEKLQIPTKRAHRGKVKSERRSSRQTPSMRDAILELKAEGFFKKPKGLADVKEKLAALGMIYPVTSLSGTVLSLVKHRELGRVKEEGRWCYVTR